MEFLKIYSGQSFLNRLVRLMTWLKLNLFFSFFLFLYSRQKCLISQLSFISQPAFASLLQSFSDYFSSCIYKCESMITQFHTVTEFSFGIFMFTMSDKWLIFKFNFSTLSRKKMLKNRSCQFTDSLLYLLSMTFGLCLCRCSKYLLKCLDPCAYNTPTACITIS